MRCNVVVFLLRGVGRRNGRGKEEGQMLCLRFSALTFARLYCTGLVCDQKSDFYLVLSFFLFVLL